MKNIDWALFHKQKEFLIDLANATVENRTIFNNSDKTLLDGVIHLMDAVQDEFETALINRVLTQIVHDVRVGDRTAIEELLQRVSTADLAAYLSEANEEETP